MFKCKDCGKEFSSPSIGFENFGTYAGLPVNERFGMCPFCRSDDIVEGVLKDVYDNDIYPGDTYYEFGNELVRKDGLEMYLADCELEA